jgi:hypothetical protein
VSPSDIDFLDRLIQANPGATISLTTATLGELLLIAKRMFYIQSHGGAWKQRVARGELDQTILAPA